MIYFIDRKHTPLDEYGNYDFESIYAIDLEKFNLDLKKLLAGEEIDDIRSILKKVRENTLVKR